VTFSEIAKLGMAVLIIIACLASYLLIIKWYENEIYIPSIPPPNKQRIQFPASHHLASDTLIKFNKKSFRDRRLLIEEMHKTISPLETWLEKINQTQLEYICLGEHHSDDTRRFLAQTIFNRLNVDILFLEATIGEMQVIEQQYNHNRPYIRLLDADIYSILKSTREHTPEVRIFGIEETNQQRQDRLKQGTKMRRDNSISTNQNMSFNPGQRHVTLMGALHCTRQAGWLFDLTRANISPSDRGKYTNISVIGEHQDGDMEAFLYFLDEAGIKTGSFVIDDTSRLPPFIRKWFPSLYQTQFEPFQSVIIFR